MSAKGLIREAHKVRLFDDFLGDVLADEWNSLGGSDADVVLPAISTTNKQSGNVLLKTGNDAGATMALNGVQLAAEENWICNRGGLLFEARVRTQVGITNVAWFVGLTDQHAALEMPFTLSGTTLTSNASNAVGFLFDTDATVDNWKMVGVADDVDATTQDSGFAPVDATYEALRVEVNRSGAATFRRNGVLIGTAMTGALQGPTGSDLLTPTLVGFARGVSQRWLECDYTLCEQNR